MIAAIKAEFRKLLTVRSTYLTALFSLLFVAFYAGYIEGFKAQPLLAQDPHRLSYEAVSAASAMAVFGAIVAVLLLAHEYRYNTIMYTLTASNSRSKVLAAKLLAVSCFAVVFTLIIAVSSPLFTMAALHLKGVALAPQSIYYADIGWRILFYGWGYAMAGLLLIALLRNQVAAIIALFAIPITVENILSLLLKDNTVYLPFKALSTVVEPVKNLSSSHGALVFVGYLVVGWLVAWVLFLRRDAN